LELKEIAVELIPAGSLDRLLAIATAACDRDRHRHDLWNFLFPRNYLEQAE
jgi:hypothetical protein